MRLLSIVGLVIVAAALAPQAMACYHDATVREQEQEFESGYDPALQPPVPEEVPLVAPEGIVESPAQHDQPQVQLAGLGGLALGGLLLGNLVLIARRRLV